MDVVHHAAGVLSGTGRFLGRLVHLFAIDRLSVETSLALIEIIPYVKNVFELNRFAVGKNELPLGC